jgi:hypothetical protein
MSKWMCPESCSPEANKAGEARSKDDVSKKFSALSVYTRKTLSHRNLDCYFCNRCGSRLMHKCERGSRMSVKAVCLESFDLRGSKGKAAVHIWIKEAIVDIPEGAEAYEGEPRGD